MRNKGRKIKRYKGSFDTKQFRRKRIIRWVVVLALLFLASYFLARPILDWGTHLWYFGFKGQPDSSESQSQTTESTPQPEATAEPMPTPAPQPSGDWASVSLQSVATPEQAQQTAQQLAQQNVKYAVIPLKAEDGTVAYASAVEKVSGSISETPVDAAAIAASFKQAGITPVAEIWAFKDPKACYTDRSMAVQYAGEQGMLWLDNAADAGGKPWLNPYSAAARQYVQDLALEAVSLGYETIVFSGVQMPQVNNLSSASFGDTGGKSYDAILNECIQQWQTALQQQQAECWFQYSAAAATGEDLRPAGVAAASLGMSNLLVQFPADTADPAAALQTVSAAAGGKNLICRFASQPDDALRQAAQQSGYKEVMIG